MHPILSKKKRRVWAVVTLVIGGLVAYRLFHVQIKATPYLADDVDWSIVTITTSVSTNAKTQFFDAVSASLTPGSSTTVTNTSPNNKSPVVNNTRDTIRKTEFQSFGKAGLERLDLSEAFDANVTTTQSVLEHGFPITWNPCTIQSIFMQKDDGEQRPGPLQLVILGGSPSASPAYGNCQKDAGDPMSSRYSNKLQTGLHQQTNQSDNNNWSFEVINMAQGATGSYFNGLTLDRLVDPNKADVLLWEFSINDAGGKISRIEFWFRRVQALFSLAEKQPPPIILLFLWEKMITTRKEDYLLEHGCGRNGFSRIRDLIDGYRAVGWSIQVIDVGSAVNRTTFAKQEPIRWGLIRDGLHPGCEGVHLIANMVQHAIYSDLASCDVSSMQATHHPMQYPQQQQELLQLGNPTNVWSNTTSDLSSLFDQGKVRVGSHSPWKPNLGWSNLQMTETHKNNKTVVASGEVRPGREDLKLCYTMPFCSTNESLSFTLLEPNLKWIGIAFNDRSMVYNAVVEVNNVAVQYNTVEKMEWFQSWVHLPGLIPLSTNYTISFCKVPTDKLVCVNAFAGVMLPP